MFASGDVIEKDNLCIFFSLYLDPLCAVARGILHGVNIYNLSISLVAEEEAGVGVGVDTEVGRVAQCAIVCLPIIVREVRWLGQQHLLPLEVQTEVLGLQTVSKVDITADLIFAVLVISDEDDGGHAAVPNQLLALSQGLQELAAVNLATSVRECFRLI